MKERPERPAPAMRRVLFERKWDGGGEAMVVVVEGRRIVGCWEDGIDDGRRKGFNVLCARKYNGLRD